jgi:hypothetical protein
MQFKTDQYSFTLDPVNINMASFGDKHGKRFIVVEW